MICIADLQKIINNWQERMGNQSHPFDYRTAIAECIFDLNTLINNELLEMMTEEDAREYLLSQDADAYLSSMEAHEYVA